MINFNEISPQKFKKLFTALATLLMAFALSFVFFAQGCKSSAASSLQWVIDTIEKEYYWGNVSADDILHCGLDNLTGNVLDIYSAYYSKEEYAALMSSNAGSKSGVGISYYYVDNALGKGIYIDSVIGNSPAYKSGLRAGTLVTGTSDGTEFTSSNDFVKFASSKKDGEEFTLVTDHGDYTMSKQDYTASYCFMATNTAAWDCVYTSDENLSILPSDSRVMSFLPEDTAYLSLSQFYGNAPAEMAELIAKFNAQNCKSLILDLRNDGGGYVSVMQYLSYIFTAKREDAGKIAMTAKYRNGKEERYRIQEWLKDDKYMLPADTQVYVLANRNTASASEALIGVLVSYGIVDYSEIYLSDLSQDYLAFVGAKDSGARSYGKGIMQSTFTNASTGEALKLTTAGIFWPNGKTIHDVGLTTDDGCKAVEAKWDVTYDDEELQQVVKMINL